MKKKIGIVFCLNILIMMIACNFIKPDSNYELINKMIMHPDSIQVFINTGKIKVNPNVMKHNPEHYKRLAVYFEKYYSKGFEIIEEDCVTFDDGIKVHKFYICNKPDCSQKIELLFQKEGNEEWIFGGGNVVYY